MREYLVDTLDLSTFGTKMSAKRPKTIYKSSDGVEMKIMIFIYVQLTD
jgi:hypothetical protein